MSQFEKTIFPTPILVGDVDNASIVDNICRLAYDFKANAKDCRLISSSWHLGAKSSNQEDFNRDGVTTFDSVPDLFYTEPWQQAAYFILDTALDMITSVYDNKNKVFTLQNLWTSVYPENGYVPMHIHSNALLSGTFYAKALPDCGNLVFQDPAYLLKTMYVHDLAEFPSVAVRHEQEVKTGRMVLFPGWLPHESLPNKSGDDRIIIGFNINMLNKDEFESTFVNSADDLKLRKPIVYRYL